MHSKAIDLDPYQLVVTFDKQKSPLNISLTSKGGPAPSFGAMAYALPAKGTPVTTLRDHQEYNEAARELASAIAQKFNRPVFANSGVNGGLGVVRQVAIAVSECLESDS